MNGQRREWMARPQAEVRAERRHEAAMTVICLVLMLLCLVTASIVFPGGAPL